MMLRGIMWMMPYCRRHHDQCRMPDAREGVAEAAAVSEGSDRQPEGVPPFRNCDVHGAQLSSMLRLPCLLPWVPLFNLACKPWSTRVSAARSRCRAASTHSSVLSPGGVVGRLRVAVGSLCNRLGTSMRGCRSCSKRRASAILTSVLCMAISAATSGIQGETGLELATSLTLSRPA